MGASLASATQTTECSQNLKQLTSLISKDFSGVFPADVEKKMIGNWSGPQGYSFPITANQPFSIQGYAVAICPQKDGSFFFYVEADSYNHGSFKLTDSGAKLYNGNGQVQQAEGDFTNR
jgi:hypothetical protein